MYDEAEMQKALEPFIERVNASLAAVEANIYDASPILKKEVDASIKDPMHELLSRPGKRWRPYLLQAAYELCGGTKNPDALFPVVELLHNSLLIQDDVETHAMERRGGDAIHLLYGRGITVNCAISHIAIAQRIVQELEIDPAKARSMLEVMNKGLMMATYGQSALLYWNNNPLYLVTEEEYLHMTRKRMGSMPQMAARLGAILADATEEQIECVGHLCSLVGLLFQIEWDTSNIELHDGAVSQFTKDVRRATITLPIIYAREELEDSERDELNMIVANKNVSADEVTRARELIMKTKALERARKTADEILDEAKQDFEELFDGHPVKKRIYDVIEYAKHHRL